MKIQRQWAVRDFLCLALLFTVLFYVLPPAEVSAADTYKTAGRTMRVAFSNTKGMCELDQNGKPAGLIIDYLNEISKYTDWTYEYVTTEGEALLNDFSAGKFDLVGGTLYDPALEAYFAYPEYSIGSTKGVLFSRTDDDSIRKSDLRTLNGKTIGVFEKASEKIRRLEKFLDFNGLDCPLRYYTQTDMQDGTLYHHLENKEVDLLLGNDTEVTSFRTVAAFPAQPYFIVTSAENTDICDDLNTALGKINESYQEFTTNVYNKYFQTASGEQIQFSEEEQAFISTHNTIKVAAIKNWHPLYCTGASVHSGIVCDTLSKISEMTGLHFEYIYMNSYDETLQAVTEGRADMTGFFLDSEEYSANRGLALTQPYVYLNNTITKNNSVNYPDEHLTAALAKGREFPTDLKAESIIYFNSTDEALKAVDAGKADYFYGLSTSVERSIQKHHLTHLVQVSMINNLSSVSFALDRPANSNLLTILNKGISALSTQELDTIINRNMVSDAYTAFSLKDMLYTNPVEFLSAAFIVLFLSVSVILLVYRYRMKSTLMKAELSKAEADSRAKGEFLSRMSHEIRTPMNAISGLADLTCLLKDVPEDVRKNLLKIRSSSRYLLALINDILDMSRLDSDMLSLAEEDFSLSAMLKDLSDMIESQAVSRELTYTFRSSCTQDLLSGDMIRLRQVLTNLLSNALKFTPAGGNICLSVTELTAKPDQAAFHFSVKDDGIGIAPEDQERIFGTFEQLGSNHSKSEGTGLGLPISSRIVEMMGGRLSVSSTPGEGSEFYFDVVFQKGSASAETASSAEALQDSCLLCLAGKHILLVEDNDLNAEIAEEFLTRSGLLVTHACNGLEAFEKFAAAAPGFFDLVLMDIQMPVLNGLDAARQIRSCQHADAAVIPILAMTANTFQEDVDAAMEAGMNGFIPKPFDTDTLFLTLGKFLSKTDKA